jgi:hypothetical protein
VVGIILQTILKFVEVLVLLVTVDYVKDLKGREGANEAVHHAKAFPVVFNLHPLAGDFEMCNISQPLQKLDSCILDMARQC